MSLFKKLILISALLFPLAATAQEKNLPALKGYSPPSMFSAPAPVVTEPAPQEAPAPIPQSQQNPRPQQAAPTPKPVTEQPKPAGPGLRPEDLLGFPTNSERAEQKAVEANPMAVPAASVETPFPLTGSVPPSKDLPLPKPEKKKEEPKPKKQPEEKAQKDSKKPESKPAAKEAPKKKAAPKKDTKNKTPVYDPFNRVETKKLPEKETKEPGLKKLEPKKAVATKTEVKKEAPKNSEAKDYKLSGKKNMPAVAPKSVESEALPLPAPSANNTVTLPSMNERVIDRALEDKLVEPEAKDIAKSLPQEKAAKAAIASTGLFSLEFKPGVTELQGDQKQQLDSGVLTDLKKGKSRLQILAYASVDQKEAATSSARRVSLARGLAIRAYLLDQGIEPTRMDVRALGDQTSEKPLDRVDLKLSN